MFENDFLVNVGHTRTSIPRGKNLAAISTCCTSGIQQLYSFSHHLGFVMFRHLLLAAIALFACAGSAWAQAAPLSRIIFASCADQNKPCPIWDAMTAAKPDLTILLGDNIYADVDGKKLKPATPEKIARCYQELAALESFKKFRAVAPILATWDDHDYGHNDAGVEWEHKDAAQKLFLDFFNVPEDSPRRKQNGVYNSAIFGPEGKRVQVIMLDLRYFRSANRKGDKPIPRSSVYPNYILPYLPVTDADTTMLGTDQWKWFESELKKPAEIRLIGSSIQLLADEHPFEKWSNFPNERAKVYQLIKDTKANGVIVLSGDRHLGDISVDTKSVGYPLYDITSSGLNQGTPEWREQDKNKYRIAGLPFGNNFGLITIDWAAADPLISMQLRLEDGEVGVQTKIRLSKLKPSGKEVEPEPADPKDPKVDPKVEPKLPEGTLTPVDALKKKEGDEVKVQFTVSAGRLLGTRILLNSEKDFRNEKNLTVVVNAKALTGKLEKATYETFKGKTVRVTGKLSKFMETLQIQVNDEKQLEIVDEKKEEPKKD